MFTEYRQDTLDACVLGMIRIVCIQIHDQKKKFRIIFCAVLLPHCNVMVSPSPTPPLNHTINNCYHGTDNAVPLLI